MGLEVVLRTTIVSLAIVASMAVPAIAQDAKGPFGGFKHDRSAPVEITADSFEVRQAEERAIFNGNVVAGQGTLRLTSQEMIVEYDEDKQSNDETGAITRVEAKGDVFLSNGAETAQGGWAEYNLETGIVKMRGDVVLTQGENAAKGAALTIDLNSGVARLDGTGSERPTISFRSSKPGDAPPPRVCTEEQRRIADEAGLECIPKNTTN